MTPGIGASRRKNVSFMHVDTDTPAAQVEVPQHDDAPSQDNSPTRKTHHRDSRPRPSALTKTLLELSKQRSDAQASSARPTPKTEPISRSPAHSMRQHQNHDHPMQADPDQTIDLSKPHSRSGQHWKSEYDQYFERSSREMKQIIQYGQNVKSYAAKRDTEASRLVDQLQQEQMKVDAMERKVVRLNKRLEVAQTADKTGEGDHARLVANIAQQSTLASKYRNECEALRNRLSDLNSGETFDRFRIPSQDPDRGDANEQLETLRQAAENASEQAQRLEAENSALKHSLARVKEEMMSYESRRLAREEKLKQREQKHKAAREVAEIQLQQLKAEGRGTSGTEGTEFAKGLSPKRENQALTESGNRQQIGGPEEQQFSNVHRLKENQPIRPSSSSLSPRKRRGKTPIDIWTMGSPLDNGTTSGDRPETQVSGIPPSSVRQDIEKTLKEIDRNIVPSLGSNVLNSRSHLPLKPKDPIGYEDGQPIWPDTSTVIPEQIFKLDAMSSPAKLQGAVDIPSSSGKRYLGATTGRSASMLSRGPGWRATSLSSDRSKLTMTEERRAATRARLAQKSAEKGRSIA